MDTQKLQIFLQLAKTLSFNKAAQSCHVSPSTLSRAIQQLEEELDTTLFIRDNRTVQLTEHGKRFAEFASSTLSQLANLKSHLMDDAKHLRGELSIYCSVTASYSFLHDILADFRREQPYVEITLHTGDPALAVSRILAGGEDLAIAAKQQPMPSSIQFQRITQSPLLLIAPKTPNLIALDEENWDQVPFIMAEHGVTRDRLTTWFKQKNISPTIYAQVAGHEAIVSLVSLGFGVGLVPKIVLDNSPLASRVEVLKMQNLFGAYEVGLCVQKKRLKNPIIRALWNQVQE